MAKQHGIPGESARVRGTMVSLVPLFAAFAFLGAFLGAMVSGSGVWLNFTLFAVSALVATALWPRAARRIGNYFAGARGEERVAVALAALPGEWHVFHDLAFGAFRSDHIAVGPGGVFAIETKNWQGTVVLRDGAILVDGAAPSRDPIAQTLREADAVRAAVARAGWKGPVRAVLCFASGTFSDGKAETNGVTILNVADVAKFIESADEAVSVKDSDLLADILASSPEQ